MTYTTKGRPSLLTYCIIFCENLSSTLLKPPIKFSQQQHFNCNLICFSYRNVNVTDLLCFKISALPQILFYIHIQWVFRNL